jgi:CheY-like chemotaxis protein/DNA-directed RNA polymerase specialized sigma24 family protein
MIRDRGRFGNHRFLPNYCRNLLELASLEGVPRQDKNISSFYVPDLFDSLESGETSMADLAHEIAIRLPYLRRYARALTGSQTRGDEYIRVCLEVLVEEPTRIAPDEDLRVQLYRLFHDIWLPIARVQPIPPIPAGRSITARLEALPPRERQVLLLTALEGFSLDAAADVMRISRDEAHSLLEKSWTDVNRQLATTVLIIEDESVIAIDIEGIVRELGHSVVGIAGSEREAISLARAKKPGLVLADINLGSGGSGIDAVGKILQAMTVPVIFVTAFPERLLTGERPEPTYLVTKPFEPDTLKATISQALANAQDESAERRSA